MPDKPTYEELEQRVRELEAAESELKRKLDALQQKENRYQNLFEHMLHEVHVWELVFDDHGNIKTWKLVDANPAALTSWNKTLPEVIGKTTDEIFPDSNATEQFLPIVEKIYREGIPHRWESYFPDTGQILHMVSVAIGDYFISTGTDVTDLKMFEETLKKREKDLMESQKTAHLGSWRLDLTTNQVEWTEELYRMYGFDPSLPPPPYTEHMKLFTPESWERLSTSLARTAETGIPYELELETVKDDGSNGWMWVRGEAVSNAEGQIVGLWGAAQDITDQKRAEDDLRNSDERLRTAIDSSPFPVAFANTNDEKILFWSQSAIKMFGHEPQKVSEWYELAYPDPDYRNEVMQRWKPFLEKTQQTKTALNTGEYRIVCQNGSIKICEIYAQYIPGNLIVTFNDITERKHAEEKLRQSRDLLVNLARLVPGVIYQYRLNPDGSSAFPWSSPGMNDIYEVTPEEVKEDATPVFGRLHPEDLEMVSNAIQESARTLNTFYCEFRVILPRQGLRWRWSQAQPERTEEGGTLWHGIISDITDRQQLEAQFRQAQKMESIGTLAGGIAHDFNNILSSIIGFTELAIDDVVKGTPLEENLQEVLTAGIRAKDLVQQILTLSRHDALEFKPIRIKSVFKEAVKMLRSTIPTSINIQENICDNQLVVQADPTQIHQVIVNLATNAKHAMSETGGVLGVDVDTVSFDESTENINLTPGNYARITVSDTGTGINKEQLEKIFEPYFTTKAIGEGSGLGLSVVRGIVKSHKGDITVCSEPGKGTKFHVYLPLSEQQSSELPDTNADPLPMGIERILLVDDEPSIVKMQQQSLERLGYTVTMRTSSVDALETFCATPDQYDLVITDMTMPDMTGDKLADEIKKIRHDVPVILCTGFSDKIKIRTGPDLQIDEFIIKPIDQKKLAKIIRKLLDKAES